MISNTEKPPSRLLTTLRDVLFEATPERGPEVSLPAPASALPSSSNIDAARAALERALDDNLGPAVREFALQVSALADVLPDSNQRKRAALRVLSLKGIGAAALVLELDRALAALAAQNDAFFAKLAARREGLGQQQTEAIESCRRETTETEQTIANLEQALAVERSKLAEIVERRDQILAETEARAAELGAKQQGFALAYASVHEHYAALKQELVALESL